MSRNGDPILRAQNLTKHYDSSEGVIDTLLGRSKRVKALDGVDLELYEGETLGIVGESGCGKTTLGRALLRLLEPTDGSVYFRPRTGEGGPAPGRSGVESGRDEDGDRRRDDEMETGRAIDLTEVSNARLRDLRTELQYVFQDPFSSLNPRLTVGEIVGEPLDVHDVAEGTERTERVAELLETVGLEPEHARRYPHEFSGGQRQRIGIARALAVEPSVLVCDEPVSALDVSVQAGILNLLADLQDEFGLSYVVIAHDLRVVEHVSDRVAVMYLGEIVEQGSTEEVFAPPYHPYTEALLSAIPEPDPLWEGEPIHLPGDVPSPIDPPSGCRFHPRCPRVIPPEAYDLDGETWRSMLSFKLRLEDAEGIEAVVDSGSARERARGGNAGGGIEPAALSRPELDELVRREFDVPLRIDDRRAEERFAGVIDRLHRAGLSAAVEAFEAAFKSPCEERDPALRSTGRTHEIACLLYDESADHGCDEPAGDGRSLADDDTRDAANGDDTRDAADGGDTRDATDGDASDGAGDGPR